MHQLVATLGICQIWKFPGSWRLCQFRSFHLLHQSKNWFIDWLWSLWESHPENTTLFRVASSAGNDSAQMQRHVICRCTTMSASEICNDENQGMKMLSASPTLCKGNPRATGGLYHKGLVMQNFDVFYIVSWNQLSNKQPYNITLATASLGDMPSSHAVSLRSLLICSTFQGSRTCLWFIMFYCVFIPADFIHILQLHQGLY